MLIKVIFVVRSDRIVTEIIVIIFIVVNGLVVSVAEDRRRSLNIIANLVICEIAGSVRVTPTDRQSGVIFLDVGIIELQFCGIPSCGGHQTVSCVDP